MSQFSPIRPVRDEADHAWALAEIEKVLHAEYGTPEGDRLEILSVLVEAYEAKHHAIPGPSLAEERAFAREQGREEPVEAPAKIPFIFDQLYVSVSRKGAGEDILRAPNHLLRRHGHRRERHRARG